MADMKTAGIVAEFNPFHSGHAFLIKKAREAGYTHIAVVMSGNYTQRGEPACMLKAARARAALLCGADLVLELPLPFAISSAERFAFGAVSLLCALGNVDAICFGSESGDARALENCADSLLALDGTPELAKRLSEGYCFPKARAMALGDTAEILRRPNDTLAVEYLKSLKRLGSAMTPVVIKRSGAAHDGPALEYGGVKTASASALRSLLKSGEFEKAAGFMPYDAYCVYRGQIEAGLAPFSMEKAEPLILSQLRRMDPLSLSRLPDVSEGLENRIYSAVRKACSLDELYSLIKSKRYTMARIRRVILCAFLGIERSCALSAPPYLRVLGFNGSGRDILRTAKKSAALPIVGRHSDMARLDESARRIYGLECAAADLYGLCLPKTLPCGLEQKFETIRIDS